MCKKHIETQHVRAEMLQVGSGQADVNELHNARPSR